MLLINVSIRVTACWLNHMVGNGINFDQGDGIGSDLLQHQINSLLHEFIISLLEIAAVVSICLAFLKEHQACKRHHVFKVGSEWIFWDDAQVLDWYSYHQIFQMTFWSGNDLISMYVIDCFFLTYDSRTEIFHCLYDKLARWNLKGLNYLVQICKVLCRFCSTFQRSMFVDFVQIAVDAFDRFSFFYFFILFFEKLETLHHHNCIITFVSNGWSKVCDQVWNSWPCRKASTA